MLIPKIDGFCVQGTVNFENVVALRSAGEQWMKAHVTTNPFVIDLSNMKDQDASSISLLLSWLRTAQKNKVSFSLLHVPQSLERMSNMFGLRVASGKDGAFTLNEGFPPLKKGDIKIPPDLPFTKGGTLRLTQVSYIVQKPHPLD